VRSDMIPYHLLDRTPSADASLEEWEKYAEQLRPLAEASGLAKFMFVRACDTIDTLRSVQAGVGLERLKDMLGMPSVDQMMHVLFTSAQSRVTAATHMSETPEDADRDVRIRDHRNFF